MDQKTGSNDLPEDSHAPQAGEPPSPFSDPIYKEIATVNGQINGMSKRHLISHLRKLQLNHTGSVDILKKRLKNFYRKQKLSSANIVTIKKLFPYYVIIDFEATCNEVNDPGYPHEIIEFPAVLVDTEKLIVTDCFQSYVKPVVNPKLSTFCITLTGITQEQVDNAEEFPAVLDKFEAWLKKHKLGTKNKYAIVTDGPWDMGRFLYGQCKLSSIPYPVFARKWVNIRKMFSNFYKCERMRLQLMLDRLHIQFEGRPHCGLDDARNIAEVLLRMINDGASIEINEKIELDKNSGQNGNSNTTNNDGREKWPVKPVINDGLKTYTQILKEKQCNDNQKKPSYRDCLTSSSENPS